MKRATIFSTAAVLVLMAVFSLSATAQQPDTRDRTIMTFSSAVELPGMRLEGGTYVFRLADTQGRNVIQLLSADEMNVLGQWLFVPAERQDVTGDTVVTFRETAANTTPAVQFWYYPGEKIGKEFIYPKDQAMRIAQRSGVAVLSDGGRVEASAQTATATAAPVTVQAEAQVAPAATTGVVDGAGLPAATAEPVGTSGQANVRQEATVAQAGTSARDSGTNELPATASPLALSGLLGLLALAGAAGVRRFRM